MAAPVTALAGWNDGATKSTILGFVARVTKYGFTMVRMKNDWAGVYPEPP